MCSHFSAFFLIVYFFSFSLSSSPSLPLSLFLSSPCSSFRRWQKKKKKGVHRPHGKRDLAFPPRAASLWLSFFLSWILTEKKKERREREAETEGRQWIDSPMMHERCQVCSPWSRSILTRQDAASRLSSLRTRALADQRTGILATGHHGRGGDRMMGSKARQKVAITDAVTVDGLRFEVEVEVEVEIEVEVEVSFDVVVPFSGREKKSSAARKSTAVDLFASSPASASSDSSDSSVAHFVSLWLCFLILPPLAPCFFSLSLSSFSLSALWLFFLLTFSQNFVTWTNKQEKSKH
ncbi:hypothetical protein TRV_05790 [Trichophyton verrucosum HKI 0517]|uniref:Uncharacterized protein n=1 Tax=Trichophyton verrucosum (strain HKI 0517) TaxID=663202 RepID=D4DF45_TRIVH|nr:uncharacterized protein TRV_05790 [Trichophyton verrucosum HKI 0517]EFE39531.1 hypothetical protein TRV_05790 [Trichophyton verrucosum HKI 0517]